MKGLHIEAPGIEAIDGSHIILGSQGKQQAGGVRVALHPLGIGAQRLKIGIGQHFHQKIAAGSTPDHLHPAVLGKPLELPGALGAGGGGHLVQAHIGSLGDLPATGMKMLQRLEVAGEMAFVQAGGGGGDADQIICVQKIRINHKKSSFSSCLGLL